MKICLRSLATVITLSGIFGAAAAAGAETCTLELKRLGPQPRIYNISSLSADYLFRQTYPQSFFMQLGRSGPMPASDPSAADFSKVVKKEPKSYASKHPFRGVARLGSQQFGFVFDSTPSKDKGDDSKKNEDKDPDPTIQRYTRLYFDLNHNGDLTDDKVIEAEQAPGIAAFMPSFAQYSFPVTDVAIEADGTKLDYAFSFTVYSNASGNYSYASASLNAGVYREGEITLDGKKRRIVLVDFNSNGVFGDEFSINESVHMANGQVYPNQGDMIFIDPDTSGQGYRSPYDPTTSESQYHFSKLLNIGGRLYDVEVTAAGDKLTLKPSSAPVGYVTNPNDGFRAVVYGEKGFMKVSGGKSDRVPLPTGEWKLLAYTIDRTGLAQPKEETAQEDRSLLQVLTEALTGGSRSPRISGPSYTLVSAAATESYSAVTIRKGETVPLPFGPPYRPVVTVSRGAGADLVNLSMAVVGSAGEACTSLLVNGRQPDAPDFTITTADGEEVDVGKFKYG